MGWGESVILVRHNLSITPPAKHNFEHNTLVSPVMPEHNPTDPTVVLFSVFWTVDIFLPFPGVFTNGTLVLTPWFRSPVLPCLCAAK